MSFPDLTFRDSISATTRKELEQYSALMNGYLSLEHRNDGAHGDVLADSLNLRTASGDVPVGGTVGATPATGAGLYLGSDYLGYYNGSAWKTYMDSSGNFYLGGTSGSLTWNGTTLAVTGTITSTAGTIGGWTLGASSLTGGNATLASSGNLTLGTSNDVARLSADDATYRAWIGHATAASAPFSVTKAGVLTASGAVFTGADITLNASATFNNNAALKFARPAGRGYGAAGDYYGLYNISSSSDNYVWLDNTIVGGGTYDGAARVYINALGWKASTQAATSTAQIKVQSDVSGSIINVQADALSLSGPVTASSTLILTPGAVTLSAGTNSNINIGAASVVRLGGSGNCGGFTGGVDGRLLILLNNTGATVQLVEEDASSTAANRIANNTGSSTRTMDDGASVMLAYDGTASRWRVGFVF